VPRGFPQIVSAQAAQIPPDVSGRLELARWIASKDNPLTARVMVNRIWQHHFGRGLVATSDNFGTRGEPPTHPELLDWLAARFMESGWSVKSMNRLILLSDTWQEQCAPTPRALQEDPDNHLLSWFPRQRLSAEEMRDSILSISGTLDPSMDSGESSEALWQRGEVIDQKSNVRPNRLMADDPYYTAFRRRTVYMPIVRNSLPDILSLFDAADPNSIAAVRNDTTVPSQLLFLMNNPLMREQSGHFADRLLSLDGPDAKRVELAYRLALGREPRIDEVEQAAQFLKVYVSAPAVQSRPEPERLKLAWQSYCQVLFCENDFLYCD
jgi:hypothetical protein